MEPSDIEDNNIQSKRQKMKSPSVGKKGMSVFDLRPNPYLLDPNFYGYKLSLDSLPLYSKSLQYSIDFVRPTVDQYSIQHVKLQMFSNHIFPDYYNKDLFYFVDLDWNVVQCSVETQGRGLSDPKLIWRIPGFESKPPGRFNVALIFPSEDLAILSDGCGNIFFLRTGIRNESTTLEKWKVEFTTKPFATKKNQQFIVLDCLLYKKDQEQRQLLDVLLLRIDEKSEWAEFLLDHKDEIITSESTFFSLVEWLTFEKGVGESSWNMESQRTLLSNYAVHYAAIEDGGSAIYIASDSPFVFAYDSERPIVKAAKQQKQNGKQEKKDFVWSQKASEVTIWFKLDVNTKKEDISVSIQPQCITVTFQNHQMLAGNLFQAVKVDEAVWTLENGTLEIVLTKVEQDLMWSSLIPGNESGEEIVDPELVAEIHNKLAHLCSDKWGAEAHRDVYVGGENEECDELPIDSAVFMRIDRMLQKTTNQASLGSHQWLFNVRTDAKSVPSFCLRHDVDGIIWQPRKLTSDNQVSTNSNFSCEHTSTFFALGYVQASKEQRKFTVCSPDLSYAAICDIVKHIHVYRQPSPLENDLRNRKTGEKVNRISKQQVIGIEPPEEIFGAFAGNEYLFILTERNIHAIQMKATEIT